MSAEVQRAMANVEIAWADDAAVHEPMLEKKATTEQVRTTTLGMRQIAKDLEFTLGEVVWELNKGEKIVRTADRGSRSARRGR